MGKIIDFYEKYKEKISYEEMDRLLENSIQVVVGIGEDGPTEMQITETNLVVGRVDEAHAEAVVACLRDVADAIEQEIQKT